MVVLLLYILCVLSSFQSSLQSPRLGPLVTVDPLSVPISNQGKVTSPHLAVQGHGKTTAPCGMERGSATSDLEISYFMPWNSPIVYRYEWSTEKWDELPPCPYRDSGLVTIDGTLTAVGGDDGNGYTNKLLTLRQGRWVEELPPMKTPRSYTALISSADGEHVFVIGGLGVIWGLAGRWTNTVELFHVRSRTWYKLNGLPRSLARPSATICGNHIHVIGDDGGGYSCFLQDLPSSDQPTMSQSRSRTILSWSPLPPLPVTLSTAATLCGQLVIVGGIQGGSSVDSIHQLVDGQWVEIGSMSNRRYLCLLVTVSPSPDKMMIVGGWRGYGVLLNSVEECIIE